MKLKEQVKAWLLHLIIFKLSGSMITINIKQKTNSKGHLVIDVPTKLIEKNVEVVLVIQEKVEIPEKEQERSESGKFDFSHLYGKLEWKGDALAEQKKIRYEWQ